MVFLGVLQLDNDEKSGKLPTSPDSGRNKQELDWFGRNRTHVYELTNK